jgi:hypothetical protein
MKFCFSSLVLLCLLHSPAANAISLNREAFSVTDYTLSVRVEPEQQRLGVRGRISIRNDSQSPQKIVVLQISSSLDWRSIKAGQKSLQFVSQPYTSDIDHTGALSEAVITLPDSIPPKGTAELEIAYEGVLVLDATRLTRIGTPEEAANSTDWDQISTKFTAVRGAGYVAWYPITTEVANLSEGNSLFEVLGRWKTREAASTMHVQLSTTRAENESPREVLLNQPNCHASSDSRDSSSAGEISTECAYEGLGSAVPSFVIAEYQVLQRPAITVHYLAGHEAYATNYADEAEKVVPFVSDWFGRPRFKAETADLPDRSAAPFESGSLLLTSLSGVDLRVAGLAAVHQLTHSAFRSPRPWIHEGLAHFAQALYLEQDNGRHAALDYMGLHRAAFAEAEKKTTPPRSEDEANRSLVNTTSDELYRSKAMYVWWMLRDIVGGPALQKALAGYQPEKDKEPSYMPRLIQAQSQRDLEWFFDDWVYRDRGLPDFKVASAFSRKTMTDAYMITITVDNVGTAGGEVPITVKFTGGEVTKRVEVRAKAQTAIRVEVPAPAQEVTINDGSVPESDLTNNTFKVGAVDAPK